MKVTKLAPVVKDYIWGGTYFKNYGKGIELDRVSECWELSLLEGNESFVANTNKHISEIFDKDSVGPISKEFPYFPILIKLIDAKSNLSVQVHPNDDYALKNEHSFGKTEMWHIISADEGAGIYVGFNDDYDRDTVYKALKDGSILNLLNFYKVKPGDTFLIEAGTVHAIGAGVRLIEIQQNSNLTYRLYDYKRKDANGNERELHIDKAIKVMNFSKYHKPDNFSKLLAKTKYFTVSREEFKDGLSIKADGRSFKSITFLEGSGFVNDEPYSKYDTFYIPFSKEAIIKGSGIVIISEVE